MVDTASCSRFEDNLTVLCRPGSSCSTRQTAREETPEQERSRRKEGGKKEAAGDAVRLIDGTIWKSREARSLMSLGADEDRAGLASRGNDWWGSVLLLMGRVPPLTDGFPSSLCPAAEARRRRTGGAKSNPIKIRTSSLA